jgi:acyl carrier protein/1-acyl-sn-glycerol-3-phosphate acyltransferase
MYVNVMNFASLSTVRGTLVFSLVFLGAICFSDLSFAVNPDVRCSKPRVQKLMDWLNPKKNASGRNAFEKVGHPVLNTVMGLRYRLSAVGLEKVAEQGNQGILFLPDHYGHTVDPLFFWLSLNKKFRPRMALGESKAQTPFMKWLVKKLNIIIIPEHPDNKVDPDFEKRVNLVMDEIAQGLRRGENFVFYPAGQIARSNRENLLGKSGVRKILDRIATPRIVLARQRGLWGSGFTFGFNGEYPDVGERIKEGIKATLNNWIFFNPRREVTITFEEDFNFPRDKDARAIRDHLEQYYNQDPAQKVTVPLYRSKEKTPNGSEVKVTGAQNNADTDVETIPQQMKAELLEILKNVGDGMGPEDFELKDTQNFWSDLGIDSIDIIVVLNEIEKTFGVTITPQEIFQLTTIDELTNLVFQKKRPQ